MARSRTWAILDKNRTNAWLDFEFRFSICFCSGWAREFVPTGSSHQILQQTYLPSLSNDECTTEETGGISR